MIILFLTKGKGKNKIFTRLEVKKILTRGKVNKILARAAVGRQKSLLMSTMCVRFCTSLHENSLFFSVLRILPKKRIVDIGDFYEKMTIP